MLSRCATTQPRRTVKGLFKAIEWSASVMHSIECPASSFSFVFLLPSWRWIKYIFNNNNNNNNKRPDGVTQIPWQAGKLMAWDVTVVSTLADSYVSVAIRGPARWHNWLQPRNARSKPTSQGPTRFCLSPLRHMVQWTRRRTTSFKSLAVESATLPVTVVKSHASFSDFPCWFKDLIQHFSLRRLLCTTTRTSDQFQTCISFYLN